MSGEEGLPDRERLPVCGQFHFRLEGGIEGSEQMGEAAGQCGIRLDDLNEVNEEDEGVVDAPFVAITDGGAGVVEVGE
jgi:hypothetical protein